MKRRKRRTRRWKKCKESIASLFALRRQEDVKEKESRKEARRPKVRQTLGTDWEVAPSPFDFWRTIGYVLALQQKDRRKGQEAMDEDAAGTSGKRRQMGKRRFHKGGGSQKEKTGLK